VQIALMDADSWYTIRVIRNGASKSLYIGKRGETLENADNTSVTNVTYSSLVCTLESGGASSEYYIDNIKIYSINDETDLTKYNEKYYTVFYGQNEDEDSVKELIGNSWVFTGDYSFYLNGAKRLYSDYGVVPVRDNEKVFLPIDFLAAVLGTEYNPEEKTIG